MTTIEELRKKKTILEFQIQQMLDKFTKEHNIEIDALCFESTITENNPWDIHYKVKLEIKI